MPRDHEMYQLLGAIDERTKLMAEKLDTTVDRIQSHDDRLKMVEAWKIGVISAAAGAGAMISGIAAIVTASWDFLSGLFHGGHS